MHDDIWGTQEMVMEMGTEHAVVDQGPLLLGLGSQMGLSLLNLLGNIFEALSM